MKNRWSEKEANRFKKKYGKEFGEDLALRTYTGRLIGTEENLVLHGGGNTSVKGRYKNILGRKISAVFVKASGKDLAAIEPEEHTGLDLNYLNELKKLEELSDDDMVNELMTHRLKSGAVMPSIEALMHAFIPVKYIDHTHADAVLTLTNQEDGEKKIRNALGDSIAIVEYERPGFMLAKAVAETFENSPDVKGIVLMKHGLLTWGDTASESYGRTIELVTQAERYLDKKAKVKIKGKSITNQRKAKNRYKKIAPVLRGEMAITTENPDWPYKRFIIRPLISEETLNFVDSKKGKEIVQTPPLTADHLIRIKPHPLWIERLDYSDEEKLRKQISNAIQEYAGKYDKYYNRHSKRLTTEIKRFDSKPRVIMMPGLGIICAGRNVNEADIAGDITRHTISAKNKIASMGKYEGLSEEHLFDMEYYSLQHEKLEDEKERSLDRSVALITGAAGAIGAGICEELLKNGCHVAATDLPGKRLDSLAGDFDEEFGKRIIGVPIDVTDPDSVSGGFGEIIQNWGGIDLVIVNAGVAHVSSLANMEPEDFHQIEKVNIEGALNTLSEASRHFKLQGTGGDVVLISTKNVFSPGARFGAYSATKAAAHQLARIASLELADMDVRVNMVSPDAVFSHGERKSGLWAEVGPDRMKARGLSEKELEEYYRNRNLLKAKVTAEHVAKAVLFFANRKTPTTGATIPVDGGLPDATPR